MAIGSLARARAACDGPIPSFREAARSAKVIVVGTVTATDPRDGDPPGYASAFEIRVDHVLKGEAGARLALDQLQQSPCSGVLFVPQGAVIALALDAQAFQPPMAVNAPAFISGVSYPASFGDRALSKPDEMTLDEVFAAAGLPIPDSAAESPQPQIPLPVIVFVLLAIAASVAALRVATPRSGPARER